MIAHPAGFLWLCYFELRIARSSWNERFAIVIEPSAYALIIGLLFRDAGTDRATLAVLGAGMMGAWMSVLYAAGSSLQTSRQLEMLEPLAATPTPLFRMTAASSVSAAILGLVPMAVAGLIGRLVFGLPMAPARPGLFLVGAMLFVLALTCVGMLLAPLFVLYPHATALANVGDYPAFILGGLVVPVLLLPGWMQPISYVFPPAWGVRLLQGGLTGTSDAMPEALLVGGAGCLAMGIGGLFLMRRLEAIALRRGALAIV